MRTYSESLQNRNPFLLLQDNKTDLFIVQSGLGSSHSPAPNHYARFVPEQTDYQLQDGQNSLEVCLSWSEGGIQVSKTYTFHRGSFVIDLNQHAYRLLGSEKELAVVPGATHLFMEPGALEEVARLASGWFTRHLSPRRG